MKVQRKYSSICSYSAEEREPYPYQRKILEWSRDRRRIALFVEMRLGKTLMTIRWVRSHTAIKRVLVVAPLTVLRAWERELDTEGCPWNTIRGSKTKRERIAQHGGEGWFLTNFETIRSSPIIAGLEPIRPENPNSRMRYTGECQWDAVIVDESTRIKNPKAQVTKCFLKGFQEVRYKAVLSGLPAPESPANYWPQMAFLNNGEWMGYRNFWHWRQKFFDEMDFGFHPSKGSVATIRETLTDQSMALSRKAAGIGNKTIRQSLTVDMEKSQHTAFRDAKDKFLRELTDGSEDRTDWAIVKMQWMHRISGGFNPDGESLPWTKKINALIDLLKGDLLKEKVVVWAHYVAEVEAIVSRCEGEGIPVTSITGAQGLSTDERWTRIDSFVEGETRIIVATPDTMKYGVTLGGVCDTAIYYSRSFGLETNRQSEDRIALPGKPSPLLILDLVTEGALDATIIKKLQGKDRSSKTILDALITAIKEDTL